MQTSRVRHSSRVSVEFTVSLASLGVSDANVCEVSSRVSVELTAFSAPACTGSGSGVLTVAICTGCVSGGSVCEDSDNDRLSAVLATSFSSAYTGSGVLTAPICCGCASGGSVCEASSNPARAIAATAAAVDSASEPASPVVVARSSIAGVWVFLIPAKLKPATAAMTVPQAAVMIANRRGLITPLPPLPSFCPRDGTDLLDQK